MARTYHPEAGMDPPPYPDESGARRAQDAAAAARDSSTAGLVSQVANDLSVLLQQEVALAKAELRQEAGKATNGFKMYGAAAAAAYFAALFLLLASMFGLAEVMATGWAALIVSVLLAVAATLLASRAKKTTKQVDPVPRRTMKTLEEDVRWAQNRRK